MQDHLPNIINSKTQQIFNGSWYRGKNTNFIPDKSALYANDGIQHILHGYIPSETEKITRQDKITAFGSCFAKHISLYLKDHGFLVNAADYSLQSNLIRFGEGMVNTYSILEQIRWAFDEENSINDTIWYSEDKQVVPPTKEAKLATFEILKNTDFLIITLGLSEIWWDKCRNRAFWKAIPANLFDPERHTFRLSTVDENYLNILETVSLLKRKNPNIRILFTLSPIPLMATFRPIGCIAANCISKSILRIALDKLLSENIPNVFYFPSYEIVTSYFIDPFMSDNRHVKPELVDHVMRIYTQYYCK